MFISWILFLKIIILSSTNLPPKFWSLLEAIIGVKYIAFLQFKQFDLVDENWWNIEVEFIKKMDCILILFVT